MEYRMIVNGGIAKQSEESYRKSKDSTQISLSVPNASVLFYVDCLDTGDNVTVNFRIKIHGDGKSHNGDLCLYKNGGELIDYGFPNDVWSRVRFRTEVQGDESGKFVKVNIHNGGEIFYISDVEIEKVEAKKPLLGGVKLYSMEAKGLMMGYVLVTKENKVIVFDGGAEADADELATFLSTLSNKVDYWFLTHFHDDHIHALYKILNSYPIAIENLYYSFPDVEAIKRQSTDCDAWLSVALDETVARHADKVKSVCKPKKGDVIKVDDSVTVKVLNNGWFEQDGKHINHYGNNSGIIYKVQTPEEPILFLGDIGERGDEYLKDEWFKKEVETCTVIQMAHHGQDCVSVDFYSVMKEIKACLYPSALWIYDNNAGNGFNSYILNIMRYRDFIRERGVTDIYVSANGRELKL